MITIVENNLLDSKEQVIAHQVNCKGVMGNGVALQVKKKWRIVFAQYKAVCETKDSNFLLGKTQMVSTGDVYIANMFSQNGYGTDKQYTDVKAFENCLSDLTNIMNNLGLSSLAMPYKIGCGLGGGDWKEIYSLLEKYFKHGKINLYLYKI